MLIKEKNISLGDIKALLVLALQLIHIALTPQRFFLILIHSS